MQVILPHEVPEFTDLLHFTEWYLKKGLPVLLPNNHEVFLSDDATATCLFRHGQYQFEMYFIHPNPKIPMHEHPGVENIEVPSAAWRNMLPGHMTEMLRQRIQRPGTPHGPANLSQFSRFSTSGFALFSAQKWDEGLEMSTIGARWKGPTVGPLHEALIRRFNPNCLIKDGYADVTSLNM